MDEETVVKYSVFKETKQLFPSKYKLYLPTEKELIGEIEREKEKYSRIVTREEIAKNDFNISPSRYIHTGAGEEYRPIAEIVEELEAVETEAAETNAAVKVILQSLGV